ncbi:glucoamylase family protein [Paraflavitalea sp. CAU 1676]|uniref:glucoamylase family protein n=1 Tax=Paraflavitalea sp. CAU 1676 TaxID=3032598 RepID=UPI0023D97A0E|nr:glucoamylase family protein [Paraflavitalea sp. CAU 1676]MDF2186828.1 glucoamylase family protein [Paraflavitalea sp. CAU 1676]
MKYLLFAALFPATLTIGCGSSENNAGKDSGDSATVAKVDTALSDTALFRLVQQQTFQYFWDGAEPTSGMGRERFHADNIYPENDKQIVTSGGSGFGVMAILAGIERGFVSREEGRVRLEKIVGFLEKADRFHGAWSHWIDGETGKVKPFGKKDNGGDLVESSFMLTGLICVRQYFANGNAEEKQLAARADKLWKDVDFNWYRNGKNVLYWHWSPSYGWEMNFPVRGYNECLIMYILAASSPTHGVPAEVYHEGWAEGGKIVANPPINTGVGDSAFGYPLHLRYQGNPRNGGPLFWAQYSYLGLDPRGLKDKYADYWEETKNQAMANYAWCVANPKHFKGYGPNNWGLTASYSVNGYAAHAPDSTNDLGVITPTAALSSFPYTPQQSMAAMKHWYFDRKDKLWGPYGFYDAFSETDNWYLPRYLAIDQGPIVVMMENYRSGLLWNLFMSSPEVKAGLKKLGFESPHLQ